MDMNYLKVCEELDWDVNEYENDVELSKFSPAGEDFSFTVSKDNFILDVVSYAEDFDSDDHAEMWVEARTKVNGVPQSVRTLIDDADAIKEMLEELADALLKNCDKVSRKLKKQEAIKRMKLLDLHENAIRELKNDDLLNMSEHGGMLFWLNDEQKAIVERLEKKYHILVYHVIHNYTEFGELYSLLYVSDEQDEWEYDIADLKDQCAMAYVVNCDEEAFSEFGCIGIKPQFGGLVRTA